MNSKNILYSCCTWLSYQIGQIYYGGFHYVWCAPYFDSKSRLNPDNAVPPTSNPKDIYWNLKREVEAGDKHSAKILQNRTGIQRGADVNLKLGNITSLKHQEILDIVAAAELVDFKPLLYIIPLEPVKPIIQMAAIKDRAHALSEEYIIERLPRDMFNAIDIA